MSLPNGAILPLKSPTESLDSYINQRLVPSLSRMLSDLYQPGAFSSLQVASSQIVGSASVNLTGPISSVNSVTSITSQTGTGTTFAMQTSPHLVTPDIGAATGTSLSVMGQLTSTLATGTPPLVVSSATLVPSLYVARSVLADSVTTNANLAGPITSVGNTTAIASQTGTGSKFVVDTGPVLVTPNIGAATGASLSVTGQLTSTVATGTAPLAVSSTTNVANLNASSLSGATFSAPGAIGGGTPGSGAFTTLTGTSSTTLGANGATGGSLVLKGATSGSAIVRVAAAAGTSTIFQLPATNGSSTNVLTTDGTGVLSWTASPGSQILISTLTANNSATSLAWTGLGSTYTNYLLLVSNLTATVGDSIILQFGEGGTPTWITSGYFFGDNKTNNAGSSTGGGSAAGNGIRMGFSNGVGGGAPGINGHYYIFNIPCNGSGNTAMNGMSGNGNASLNGYVGGWLPSDTTAKTAIRILDDTGNNLVTGVASLYGFVP